MRKILIIMVLFAIMLGGCHFNQETERGGFHQNPTENAKAPEQKTTIKELVVLYRGIPLNLADQAVDFVEGIDLIQKTKVTDQIKQRIYNKYEREYYVYSNHEFKGRIVGKIEERGLDYPWQVSFPKNINGNAEIAISQFYDPYPRGIKELHSNFPNELKSDGCVLKEINRKFEVSSTISQAICVDLDGNGSKEYLVSVIDEKKYFFAKCLIDSNFKIISYLTEFKADKNNPEKMFSKDSKPTFQEFIENYDINDDEVIDIDNDGIMEIITNVPAYEIFDFQVFKYENTGCSSIVKPWFSQENE